MPLSLISNSSPAGLAEEATNECTFKDLIINY